MKNVFIHRVFHHEILTAVSFEAITTDINISLIFRFISFDVELNFVSALVAENIEFVIYVVFAQLIAQRQPSLTQVVVSRKELDFVRSRHQQIYQSVYLVWFLRLLSDLCKQQVVRNFGVELNVLVWRALVAYEACL